MFKQIDPQQMRYQKNSFSFWFCILSLIFGILEFCIFYSVVPKPSIRMGADIMLSIFFMLAVFWGAEKTKIYTLHWTIVLYIVATVQVLRIVFAPLFYVMDGELSIIQFIMITVLLILSAMSLVFAGIANKQKCLLLYNYLESIGEKK
ncbi:MAG: hypothetical protein LBU60_03675 [Clostridiales bacterium]|jgi:hypothetical protein|nr:hypothetical protein [Clostridiales bacterium]